ncbi:CHAD domain-containing protein [Streptomyces sp. Tu 3180]|uniref:CHAD domain-containing protein n=1 Tax=Streptomyces sp. Tu 3180 TaxID=2682611 RepID=UPI0013568F87|nr:CHAD domain-containing protein [Streptomyces sp. Tu 3180]KAF3466194.1 CHAD domain-containing protein [Streptomyces sp. Tu 3180]
MAQQHLDPTDPTAGPVPADALTGYLRAQATEFLRALRLHRETGAGAAGSEGSVEAARALRRAARRISASLHTFQPVLDPEWSEAMRPELAWVSGTLALEHACAARLERLLLALHRLSGAATAFPDQGMTGGGAATTGRTAGGANGAAATVPATVADGAPGTAATATEAVRATAGRGGGTAGAARAARTSAGAATVASAVDRGNLTVGAAKAGALLDRQLTLARTRAHSTALQALGSSRFHAVADKVAVLASEVPLAPAASAADLAPLAAAARERLADAVAALPLLTAGSPYNAEALIHGLSPDPSPHPQDAPWHQVRLLLRLHRYAREVLQAGAGGEPPADVRLLAAGEALDRHRDASEAAAAAAQAARTPRIAPATAYALGVLHADQRHEVEAARYAFQRSWQKDVVGTL